MSALRGWYPLRPWSVAVGSWVLLWSALRLAVPTEATSSWLALIVVVAPVSAVAAGSSVAGAEAWALGRGARFSSPWNQLLWRHLTRTRVARTFGVTAGFGAQLLANAVYNAGGGEALRWWPELAGSVGGYWMAALGYVVASLWAERTKPHVEPGRGAGTAMLTPRRLADYLDPNVGFALGLFALVMVGTVTTWSLVPMPVSSIGVDPEWVGVLAPGVLVVIALLGAGWTARRTERAGDGAALAYEELTRAASVNALVGAAIAMLGELMVSIASLPRDGQQVSGWILLVPGLMSLLGVVIWIGCGTKLVFRSRRIDTLRAAS